MNYYDSIKLKRAKLLIADKEYSIGRADRMNDKVQHWKLMLRDATTITEKEFCLSMIKMYLKRYMYYVLNKGVK
jgi:hypothetical protein